MRKNKALDNFTLKARVFLEKLYDFVQLECTRQKINQKDFRFTRRQISTVTGLSVSQVGIHLDCLCKEGFAKKHSGRTGLTNVYELIYKGCGRTNINRE